MFWRPFRCHEVHLLDCAGIPYFSLNLSSIDQVMGIFGLQYSALSSAQMGTRIRIDYKRQLWATVSYLVPPFTMDPKLGLYLPILQTPTKN